LLVVIDTQILGEWERYRVSPKDLSVRQLRVVKRLLKANWNQKTKTYLQYWWVPLES